MQARDISEDQIILHYTNEWMTDKGVSKQRFARDYLVPALARAELVMEEPSKAESYELWFDSRRKMISKMLSCTGNIPLAWKWVWVKCLPNPYQKYCRQDLLALNGSFYLPLPEGNKDRRPMASKLAELTREFGEVMAASKPAQDGMLDMRDEVEDLREYAGQLLDLIEKASLELLHIQTGTGVMGRRQLLAMLNQRIGTE